MRTRRLLSRTILAVCSLLAFPITSMGTGNHPAAHAAPALISGRASSASNFNTTLAGPSSDGKHTVSINVDWDHLVGTHVTVEITVATGTALQSGLNGSTYSFEVPARDLQLGHGTASLDTHKDLGTYGHVSGNWTFVIKTETNTGCFGSDNTQHMIASGSASYKLSLPCAGSLSGRLSGTNVDSDALAPSSSSNKSSFAGLSSIYFSAASAQKSIKSGDIAVGAYTFGNMGSFIYVSLGAGNNGNSDTVGGNGLTAAEFGLTQYSHFAGDKLPSGAFTSSATGANLNYSGALGKAKLSWKSTGSPFSVSLAGHCLSSTLPGSEANATVVMSSQQASVSGSASVTACVSGKATFGSSDTGALINTHKGTATAPGASSGAGAGTGSGSGSGTAISSGSFAVSSASPANGATGVSTSTAISVTFNAAPGKVAQIILTEATNPTGIVMLPPPAVSGNTITSTPPAPLKPNTQYKETVVAQGAAGGFVSYTATFTTAS